MPDLVHTTSTPPTWRAKDAVDQNPGKLPSKVKAIFNSIDLYQHFHLPLSAQDFDELNLIRYMLVSHTRDDTCKDLWFWQGSSKVYKPKLFYGHVFQNETFNHLLCWIWKSSCTIKIKVFAWMLIMDRLNTKDMVDRRHWHMDDGVTCRLCPLQVRETRDHLLFNCNFSVRVWNYL